MSEAKFSIGIDLGTTHCALSYVDIANLRRREGRAGSTADPAIDRPRFGRVAGTAAVVHLPAACQRTRPGDLGLPWTAEQDYAVGEMARSRGAATPIRLVSSAKSWLCHAGVDRRAASCRNDAPPEVARLSPLEASLRYLSHLRAAWDEAHPEAPFAEQEIVVTIPASFDPAARELTAEAARAAGCERMILLEEPQAALYSWIQKSAGSWRKQVRPGDIILVVDVGGGTSDFSLIAVLEREGTSNCTASRSASTSCSAATTWTWRWPMPSPASSARRAARLDAWQLRALTHACRSAKEALLSDPRSQRSAAGHRQPRRQADRRLDAQRTDARRTDHHPARRLLPAGRHRRPSAGSRSRRPDAARPALRAGCRVTRHLAAFLARQVAATADLEGFSGALPDDATAFLHPTAVLFNGGVFKSELLAERTLATVNSWLAAEARRRPACSKAPTSTWPSPAAPPTTATSAAARACASAAARRVPTTSRSNR
jgi:hypothetical protein